MGGVLLLKDAVSFYFYLSSGCTESTKWCNSKVSAEKKSKIRCEKKHTRV